MSLAVAVLAALVVLIAWPPARPSWTPRPGNGPGEAEAAAYPRGTEVALVPEAMELLALALQGGGSLAHAAAVVGQSLPPATGAALVEVSRALRAGVDPGQAWGSAGEEWDAARRAVELAAVAGVAPGPALRAGAADLRREAVGEVEVATARLGVRLVLPLGLTFLPAFVLTTVVPLVLALTRDLSW